MIFAMIAAALLSSLLILPWMVIIFGPICLLIFSAYPLLLGILGVYRWYKKPLIIILDPLPPRLLTGPLVLAKSIK